MTDLETARKWSMAIWKHNSMFGHVALSRRLMLNIISAPSATNESKQLASEALSKLEELYETLKVRNPEFEAQRQAVKESRDGKGKRANARRVH